MGSCSPKWFQAVCLIFVVLYTPTGAQLATGSKYQLSCPALDECSDHGTCYDASRSLNPYADPQCLPDWLRFNSHCFKFEWKLVTWEKAKETCQQHGAILFNANTTDFYNFFKSVITVMYLKDDSGQQDKRPNLWTELCDIGSKRCKMITSISDYSSMKDFPISALAAPLCLTNPKEVGNPLQQCSCTDEKRGIKCDDVEDDDNYSDLSLCSKSIHCLMSQRIQIDFAAFGQLKGKKLCTGLRDSTDISNSDCYAYNTMYLLKYLCQGKRDCDMTDVSFQNEIILKRDETCNPIQDNRYSFTVRRTCVKEEQQHCVQGDLLINETETTSTCLRPLYGKLTWWRALDMCRSIGGNLIFLKKDPNSTYELLNHIERFELLHPPETEIWIGAEAKNIHDNKQEYQACASLQVDMVNRTISSKQGVRNLECDVKIKQYWLCKLQPFEGTNGCPHNATPISLDANTRTCYLLGQYKLIWGEARAKCQSLNGSLATFYNELHAKNIQFYEFISENLIALAQDYWIAGIDNQHRPINGTLKPCSRVKQDKSFTQTHPLVGNLTMCNFSDTRNALCVYPPSDISTPITPKNTENTAVNNSFVHQNPIDHVSYSYNSPNTATFSTSVQPTEILLTSPTAFPVTPRISLKPKKPNKTQTTLTNPLTTVTAFPANNSSFSLDTSEYVMNTTTPTLPTASTLTSTITNIPSTISPTYKMCDEQIVYDPRGGELKWPETEGGKTTTIPCPEKSTGTAKWYCDPTTGKFVPHQGPDLSNCISLGSGLLDELEKGELPINVADDLLDTLDSSIYGGDLDYIMKISKELHLKQKEQYISLSKTKRLEMATNFTTTMVNVFDNLMKEKQSYAWLDISEQKRGKRSSKLLELVDSIARTMSENLINDSSFAIKKDNMGIYVSNVPRQNIKKHQFQYPPNSKEIDDVTSIYLPNSVFETASINGDVQSVFAKYRNMTVILPSSTYSWNSSDNSSLLHNSEVMSASVFNKSVVLSDNETVKVVFKHKVSLRNSTDVACVFWNIPNGRWDNEGCFIDSHNETHTICSCNHLTNFAVLMDIGGVLSKDSNDYIALTWITIVGCTISIVCMALSVIIFLSFRSLWNLRNSIHCNLCSCLLISQVVLLAGLDRTESRVGCGITAGLLHYFWLASFVWMAAEGVMIYILLIKVFDTGEQKAWHYYTACYGIPGVIVLVSVSCKWEGYGTDRYCWLSTQDGLIFAFAAPLAALVLFNIVILIMALKVAASVTLQRHQSRLTSTKLWIKRAGSLVPLLGLTWVFGFLYINDSAIVFAYLFAIFNSLQGIFIFIFHCLRNEKVQQVLTRYIAKKRERLDSLTFSGKPSRSNSCTATSTVRSVTTSDTSFNNESRTANNRPNGIFTRGRVTPTRWKYKLDISRNGSTTKTKECDNIKDSLSSIPSKMVSSLVTNMDHHNEDNDANGTFFRIRSSSDVSC